MIFNNASNKNKNVKTPSITNRVLVNSLSGLFRGLSIAIVILEARIRNRTVY